MVGAWIWPPRMLYSRAAECRQEVGSALSPQGPPPGTQSPNRTCLVSKEGPPSENQESEHTNLRRHLTLKLQQWPSGFPSTSRGMWHWSA